MRIYRGQGTGGPCIKAMDRYAKIIRNLLEAGYSSPKIARKMGWSNPNTVSKWIKQFPELEELRMRNARWVQANQTGIQSWN